MGLDDITNPLNQAESTLKAARGVLKEGKGLVKDIAETAEEYRQYKEKKEDQRAIQGNLSNKKATQRIAKRATNAAIADHDAAVTSAQEIAKQVLIQKKAYEEEQAMIWAMSQDERDAYLAAKKDQTERVKAEKLRMIREADEARERLDLIINVLIGIFVFIGLAFGGFIALDYFLAHKVPWRD
jgi:cysteinyl-tRNA synthetase